MSGWIKIYRKYEECAALGHGTEWSLVGAWVAVLTAAQTTPTMFMGEEIGRGEFGFTYRTLQERWKKSPTRIQHVLRHFERHGMVKIRKVGSKCSILRVVNYDDYQTAGALPKRARERYQNVYESGNEVGNEVGNENKNKKNVKKLKNPLPPNLDTPEFREAWESWIRHRNEKRSPMTPTAADRLLKQLSGWGPSRSAAAIEHSLANGYTGVYEQNGDSHDSKSHRRKHRGAAGPGQVFDRDATGGGDI